MKDPLKEQLEIAGRIVNGTSAAERFEALINGMFEAPDIVEILETEKPLPGLFKVVLVIALLNEWMEAHSTSENQKELIIPTLLQIVIEMMPDEESDEDEEGDSNA